MNISELYQLSNWMLEQNQDNVIDNGYSEFINAVSNGNNAFSDQKERLFKVLADIELSKISKEQELFLDKLNILNSLGWGAINQIEDVLYINAIDRQTAQEKVSEMYKSLTDGMTKLNALRMNLEGCVDEEKYELDGDALMRIGFKSDASINNIDDFKKWANTWFKISHGITKVNKGAAKDIKIISATKGSIIFELAVALPIVKMFTSIVLDITKSTESFYNIRKLKEEAKALKLNNEILEKFDNEILEKKEGLIDSLYEKLCEDFNLNSDSQGDKKNDLRISVKELVNFIDKGGDVDFVVTDESESDTEVVKKLRSQVREIREIEQKTKLIERKD